MFDNTCRYNGYMIIINRAKKKFIKYIFLRQLLAKKKVFKKKSFNDYIFDKRELYSMQNNFPQMEDEKKGKESSNPKKDEPLNSKTTKSAPDLDQLQQILSHSGNHLESIHEQFQQSLQEVNSQPQQQCLFQKYLEQRPEPSLQNPVISSKYFFKTKVIGKGSKVTNQIKHYARKFIQHFEDFSSGMLSPQQIKTVKKVLHPLVYKSRNDSKKVTLNDLTRLFREGKVISSQIAKQTRRIMNEILLQDSCSNSSQQNRLRHLIASKVYALRCRSEVLMMRNTIH